VYVCIATNKFGSATCKITLSECPQCLTATEKTVGGEDKYSIFRVAVIGLSCAVALLLIMIALLVWRLTSIGGENKHSRQVH